VICCFVKTDIEDERERSVKDSRSSQEGLACESSASATQYIVDSLHFEIENGQELHFYYHS
jgi:hypothetical protein